MSGMDETDHRLEAWTALQSAEDGLELVDGDDKAAAALYAQIGIGHALMHVAEVLREKQ